MDMADLIELNHQVVKLINHKRSHEAMLKSLSFKVGDKVSFNSKRSGRMVGEIVKINRTRAVVAVQVNGVINKSIPLSMVSTIKWNVPFSMLTKVSKGQ